MLTCMWIKKVDAFVDGELRDDTALQAHLDQCAICARHHARLVQMREALCALPATPALSDDQFPAFMEGIRVGFRRRSPSAVRAVFGR